MANRFVSDKMALERQLTKYGLDGVGLVHVWRGQTFMHTFNHPTDIALESLAKALASRLGFAPESVSLHGLDPLSESTRWPVCPEIARRIGVEGSLVFKHPEVNVSLDLSAMIVKSYALLEPHRDAVATNPRISATVRLLMPN